MIPMLKVQVAFQLSLELRKVELYSQTDLTKSMRKRIQYPKINISLEEN